MHNKKSIAIDAIIFGCRTFVSHIRLYFFIGLTTTGITALLIALLGLFNKDFIASIIYSTELQNIQQCVGSQCLSVVYESGSPVLGLVMGHLFSLLISSLLLSIFFVGFDLGFKKVALNIYDNDTSKVKTLFSSIHLAPQTLIAWIFYCSMVCIGGLFFIIPGLIALLRFAFFPFFIIDKNAGPIQALKMSYHATRNHVWDIFAFWLIIKVITHIGFLNPSVIIITWPISALAYTYFYRHLTNATKDEHFTISA